MLCDSLEKFRAIALFSVGIFIPGLMGKSGVMCNTRFPISVTQGERNGDVNPGYMDPLVYEHGVPFLPGSVTIFATSSPRLAEKKDI